MTTKKSRKTTKKTNKGESIIGGELEKALKLLAPVMAVIEIAQPVRNETMPTNDEIKPSLKEKIYQETLDEFCRTYWNTFKDWKDCRTSTDSDMENKQINNAIEKAVKLAIDKTEAAAHAEGYKEGQTDTVKRISKAIKELDDKLINPDYDDLKAVIEAVQKQFKVD